MKYFHSLSLSLSSCFPQKEKRFDTSRSQTVMAIFLVAETFPKNKHPNHVTTHYAQPVYHSISKGLQLKMD